MSNQFVTPEILFNISKSGIYYNPASSHYGIGTTNVICDRCRRSQLDVCIGWKTYDMCLKCISEVVAKTDGTFEIINPIKLPMVGIPVTMMVQSQFKPDECLSFMNQNQFKPTTRMVQEQFKQPGEENILKKKPVRFGDHDELLTFMMQRQFKPATKMMQNQFSFTTPKDEDLLD